MLKNRLVENRNLDRLPTSDVLAFHQAEHFRLLRSKLFIDKPRFKELTDTIFVKLRLGWQLLNAERCFNKLVNCADRIVIRFAQINLVENKTSAN